MTTMPFSEWIVRFTDQEYSLLTHRMRGIQFVGPGVLKRWDQCSAENVIDLNDPVMPGFKQALIKECILSPARAEVIFRPELNPMPELVTDDDVFMDNAFVNPMPGFVDTDEEFFRPKIDNPKPKPEGRAKQTEGT